MRGIRDLIAELALLPVEGGARVAIVESAHRMNEDAQAALLKTLEEPPPATTIVLCADAEEPLLPTIRSRCARIRLGPVGVRDIEAILAEHGAADPPLAARVARIAGGRPGVALAWVGAPDALRDRDAIGRTLLDLADARPADRLAGVRALAAQATTIAPVGAGATRWRVSRRGRPAESAAASDGRRDDPCRRDGVPVTMRPTRSDRPHARHRTTPRGRGLVAIWTDVTRDVALCQRGLERSVRDIALLDDTLALAGRLDPAAARRLPRPARTRRRPHRRERLARARARRPRARLADGRPGRGG